MIEELPNRYKTKAALGKAASRAAKALPEDTKRAQEVVSSLQARLDTQVGPEQVEVEDSRTMMQNLSGEDRLCVCEGDGREED